MKNFYIGSCNLWNVRHRYRRGREPLPLGLTLELYKGMMNRTVTWTAFCKQLSTDRQGAVWFVDG